MFWQVLEELKSTISFNEKVEFIEKCHELNTLRIEIVHRLTLQPSLKSIQTCLTKTKKLFDDIFELFDTAHDIWRVTFKDFQKNSDWD